MKLRPSPVKNSNILIKFNQLKFVNTLALTQDYDSQNLYRHRRIEIKA